MRFKKNDFPIHSMIMFVNENFSSFIKERNDRFTFTLNVKHFWQPEIQFVAKVFFKNNKLVP